MTDVGKMYGGALFELCAEEARDEAVRDQLRQVTALMRENPDYEKLLCTPNIPKAERCALLDEALRGQVDPYLLNFLKILCENGTLRQLSACEKEFSARYNAARGILPAKAVSAVPSDRGRRRPPESQAGKPDRQDRGPELCGGPGLPGRHPAGDGRRAL